MMARSRAEKGSIGLPLFSGRLSLDTNRRLRWPTAGRIYRQMWDDSPPVGALWTAIRTLLRTDVVVSSGGSTDADKQIAASIERSISNMDIPIATVLRQMATAALFGFDVHEIVYRRNDDGSIGWKKWGLRRQETLDQWLVNANGEVAGFQQRPPPDYRLRHIWFGSSPKPRGAGYGMHLVADDSDGSPEGRSVLRPMYRYWYMVTQFELLAGIGVERGVGFPVFERVDDGAALTPAQEESLAEQAERIRQHEQMYILLPPGIKFRFAEMPGVSADSYLAFIQRYNVWMLATALAEFVALGTGESSGSRALGSSKIDLFLRSLTGFQDRMTDCINRQAIRALCRYNGWIPGQYAGMTDYPTVSLPAVREYDLRELGVFLQMINKAGAFHVTPEDEQWFRRIANLVDVDIQTLRNLANGVPDAEQPEVVDDSDTNTDTLEEGDLDGENEENPSARAAADPLDAPAALD